MMTSTPPLARSETFPFVPWLVVDNATNARTALLGRFAFLSPHVVTLTESTPSFTQALIGRDPDGHLMLLGSQIK